MILVKGATKMYLPISFIVVLLTLYDCLYNVSGETMKDVDKLHRNLEYTNSGLETANMSKYVK